MSHHQDIVAFLQNQWFKNPERVRETYRKFGEARRQELNKYFLFRGCVSGKRLITTFGEALCDKIVWEETSREIGGEASAIFPADIEWMIDVLKTFTPLVVITFGKHAENAFCELQERFSYQGKFIRAMHPAARHPDIIQTLKTSANVLNEIIGTQPATHSVHANTNRI